MESYAKAKSRLFQMAGLRLAVLNRDEAYSAFMAESALSQTDSGIAVRYYSLRDSRADLFCSSILKLDDGFRVRLSR